MLENKIIRFLKSNADSICISLIAFFSIVIFTGHNGIGISPDSVAYVSTARNIHEHWIMNDYNLKPLVAFPAFYPIFLSAVMFISGTDIVKLGTLLNGFLLMAVLLFTSRIIDRFQFHSPWYRRILLLLMAFSPALTEVFSMLWSETLLILLSLLFFLQLRHYLSDRTFANLVRCAVLAGLATVTRYAGVTLIGTACMLIFFAPAFPSKQKAKDICLFVLIAAGFLFLNLLRNQVLVGSLTGPRQAGFTPLIENIGFYGQTLGDWFPVFTHDHVVAVFTGLSVFTLLTLFFLYRTIKGKNYIGMENICTAFVLVYSVFIVGISTLSHFEGINNRLLIPIFIPGLLSLSSWFPVWINGLNFNWKIPVTVSLLFFLLFFQFNAAAKLDEMYQDAVTNGIPGYADDSWKHSETARFLAGHRSFLNRAYKVYSNAHDALYFKAGVYADELPHHVDMAYQEKFFKEKTNYIIWFNQIDDPELIKLSDIFKHRKLLKKYRFKDGWIFLFGL